MTDILLNLANGFAIALTPGNLLYGLIGAFLGTAIGVLPGLGPPATIALLLPVTYKLDPVSAVIMLSGIFYGAMFGGSTTSILLNIPGEPASVVTCLDGYSMARNGRAGPALGASAIGSFFGGIVSVLGLVLVAPALAAVALKFGPPEYFSLVILGLMMAVYLSEESVLKGLIMGVVGILLGTIGIDPAFGAERFTFGISRLSGGIDFVIVGMGLFGIGEVLINLETPEVREIFKTSLKGVLPNREDWRRCLGSMIRGSIIGSFIGVLPGGGAVISSFVAYATEKRISKHPERFGKGAIEGVMAPETANNAAATSSFIPLLTLGIPGNLSIAMIFVALMIHGIRPGPTLIQEHPEIFWGVVASMFVGNAILLALNLPLLRMWVTLLRIPYRYLVVVIVVICIIGAYSVNYTSFDVGAMMVFVDVLVPLQRLERKQALPFFVPDAVQRQVDGDPVKKGGQFGRGLVRIRGTEKVDEHVLRHLFGVLLVGHVPEAQIQDPALVGFDDPAECRFIALPHSSHQVSVIRRTCGMNRSFHGFGLHMSSTPQDLRSRGRNAVSSPFRTRAIRSASSGGPAE